MNGVLRALYSDTVQALMVMMLGIVLVLNGCGHEVEVDVDGGE